MTESIGEKCSRLIREEQAIRQHGQRVATRLANGNGLDAMHIYNQALLQNQVDQCRAMSLARLIDEENRAEALR